MDKNEIIKKVEKGIPLTPEESKFYMVNVMGMTPEDAEHILAINANTDPGKIVD